MKTYEPPQDKIYDKTFYEAIFFSLVLCYLCYFVPVFFNLFSIAIISLGEARGNRSVFCTFV